ncbi:MAG: XRE family transcriptional regulator [Nitrospira sp.]|nr:XRE family transcriptional regulator [Nitrospira sp.]
MEQPKVSQLRHLKLQNISLERLMYALVSPDQHIEILVKSAYSARSANITATE